MEIYGDYRSGNCYKLKMLCDILKIEHTWRTINILKGESRSADFLQLNPNGRIPVVLFDNDETLWESNAILFYLAQGSPLVGENAWQQAQILQWQFFEQYSHEPYIAVRRFIQLFLGLPKQRQAEYHSKYDGGIQALEVMEDHLSRHTFFVGERLTIADISLFAYTHVAHEGGFDTSQYTGINRWLNTIKQSPGFVSMSDALANHQPT